MCVWIFLDVYVAVRATLPFPLKPKLNQSEPNQTKKVTENETKRKTNRKQSKTIENVANIDRERRRNDRRRRRNEAF